MTQLFIAGFPGTGKTTFAEYLKNSYGFKHIDLEALNDSEGVLTTINNEYESGNRDNWLNKIEEFCAKSLDSHERVVVTWGFHPGIKEIDLIQYLKTAKNFRIIWFEGRNEISKCYFEAREKQNIKLDSAELII